MINILSDDDLTVFNDRTGGSDQLYRETNEHEEKTNGI